MIDDIFGTELRRTVEESLNDRSVSSVSKIPKSRDYCAFFPASGNLAECRKPFYKISEARLGNLFLVRDGSLHRSEFNLVLNSINSDGLFRCDRHCFGVSARLIGSEIDRASGIPWDILILGKKSTGSDSFASTRQLPTG